MNKIDLSKAKVINFPSKTVEKSIESRVVALEAIAGQLAALISNISDAIAEQNASLDKLIDGDLK